MKWLKKGSSSNEQTSIAESQPGPEHPSEQAPTENVVPEPETLEHPDVNEGNASMQEVGVGAPAQPERLSGRRRQRNNLPEDGVPEKSARFNPMRLFGATWLAHHWKTIALLAVIFCLAFFARAYYGLGPATDDGFVLSGGSDSYYHHYVITYGTDTGGFHFWDNMLNYPIGTRNPRPPFYDWSVALMGMGLSPFFDGDLYTSTFYVFLFSTALWGALTVFPTYFLAKEAFGKKAGMIAAFLLAIMPGHVQRSVLTNADHDAIALFFIVTSIFFFLKALKTLRGSDWIKSWDKPKEAFADAKSFFASNQVPVLYAVLSGLSIAGVALIWQGFAYAIVLIALYFLIQILINRFRNVDSFGVFIIFTVTVGVGLLLAFPYYYQSIQIPSWFDTPAYLFLGLVAFALALMVTRKYPWFLVLSSLTAIGLLSIIMLDLFAHSFYHTIINALLSGGGYFINNKQYQTIAEAQAPAFSTLSLSFGIFTFWLSFVGVAWAAIQLPKSWKADFTFILLWAGSSIYMAVSAARFMFNASPAFAITAGWVVALIIEKLDIRHFADTMKRMSAPHMSRNFKAGLVVSVAVLVILAMALLSVSSMAYPIFVIGLVAICGIYMLNLIAEVNPNRIYNLLTALIPASGAIFYLYAAFYTEWVLTDATHWFILAVLLTSYVVLYLQVRKVSFLFTAGVFFLAFCIVVPNVWSGLDAGIPYETKTDYDKQIYDSMPTFMQPDSYDTVNGTNWYIGGFGYSLPLNKNYWPAAYDWLATQDANITPASDKPAFLSWWDYGFEIVNEGKHPTVADNFLGGHQLAGNVLMAQSEEDVIALVCTRILEGSYYNYWEGLPNGFTPEIVALMDNYGINTAELEHMFVSPGDYIPEILAHPDKYGPRDDVIQDVNAKYIVTRVLFTQTLDEESLVEFYHDLSALTGYSVRYFGVDSRLFPFSADNTGIFYAPAKLSDHRIDETANQPYDFWQIKAVGEFGGEYDLDEIPPDVNLNQDAPYKIVYNDMFYNSMLYKTFIGYSGADIGQGTDAGIPGLSGTLASNQIMPGWNMTHFKLVHRTSYWNPYSAEEIQNHTDAWRAMNFWDAYEKQQAGDGISDLSDRSSIYQGVMMLKYYDGAIISGKVTLEDGTPVQGVSVTVSDEFGIPHQRVMSDEDGQYSIIAPFGDISLIASTGTADPLTMVGTEVNVTSMTIEDYQAMRENEDRDGNGVPDYMISQNLVMKSGGMSGKVFWDIDGNAALDQTDSTISNANITLSNTELLFETAVSSDSTGAYSVLMLPPGTYTAEIHYANQTIGTQQLTVQGGVAGNSDIAIAATTVSGTVKLSDETPVENAVVKIWNWEERMVGYVYSDLNGSYNFDNIMFGDFFAQAYSDEYGYASTIERINIQKQGNNTFDFLLYSANSINGTITINSAPAKYATLTLTGQTDVITKADSSGQFSIVLENGVYTYYVEYQENGILYASAGQFLLDKDLTLDIGLQPGTMVTGKLRNSRGIAATYCEITFENVATRTLLSAVTDNGDYSIKLPQGSYLVQVSSPTDGSYYAVHSFTTKMHILNISTGAGSTVSGVTFCDVNGNGIKDTNEQVYNTRVSFVDPAGNQAISTSDLNGVFGIVLPSYTQYHMTFTRNGFETVDFGTFTPAELGNSISQPLVAIPVPISGKILIGNESLTGQNIHVKFISQNEDIPSSEIQAGRDGTFSGSLEPGIYKVSFIQNITMNDDSAVYQMDMNFMLDTGLYNGVAVMLELQAVLRNKVQLSLTNTNLGGANISFRYGPEERYFDISGTSGTFYAMPGNYVISSYHAENETVWLDMQEFTVLDHGTSSASITLKTGVSIQGTLYYLSNSVPEEVVTFRDLDNNGTATVSTDENGHFNIPLVPGHRYEATVDFVNYENEPYFRAYRYYSTGTIIDVNTALPSYQILLDRENYFITFNGTVFTGDSPAPNTEVTFIAEFGNYTALSDPNGNFTVTLPPAEYTIYAHQQASHRVVFEQASIEIEQGDITIGLFEGYRVYGTAYYDLNKKARTDIVFSSSDGTNITIPTDDVGYYETWLPANDYSITGSLVAVKDGIDITYSLQQNLDLSADTQINLALSMKEERIVFVSVDPAQVRETPANSTVRYSFQVENVGNIRDTYILSATGGDPDWEIELGDTSLTLDAEAKVTVPITVHIPATARIDYSSVSITAVSQKDASVTHTNSINCLIKQEYAFTIEPVSTSPTFAQGDISSEFSVVNEGNGGDRLTLYIGNKEDLASRGWNASFGTLEGAELTNDATRIVNVSVGYGTSSTIPITLTPTNDNPSRQVSVLITGYSQSDETAFTSRYIVLKYPELQVTSTNLTVTGMEVSEQAAGDQLINISVMVVAVASALALFYYARKRRWIR